jgi:cytosine/adenosine deaminase-related metal-dependent hydrolase
MSLRVIAFFLTSALFGGTILKAFESAAADDSPVLVIRGGQLFDPALGRMTAFGAVFIERDRIQSIIPADKPVILPAGARVIDAQNRFLIPGLIDGHVHLVHVLRDSQVTADEIFPLFLASGVTTLRDVGDEVVAEKLLFKYAEAHPQSAPRVVMGSPLIDGNPPYHPFIGWPLTDPAKVPAFVDEMVGWGVQTFKLYVGASRPVAQAVIREAHRHGKWVTAHLAWNYRAQDAIADGIDSLEHVGSIFEFILPPETPRWPPPVERARIPPAELAKLQQRILEAKAQVDLNQPATAELIAALIRNKVAIDPTLVVYRNWMLLRDEPEVLESPDLHQIPQRLRDGWMASARANPLDRSTVELRRQQFAKLQELTGRLHQAGVELLVGTDTPVQFCPPGLALHQELELLVASRLSPAAALTAATRNNARAINQTAQLGSIEPGKLADLVILDADPLQDIRNTRKIFRVIRSGIVCDPTALLQMVPAN